MTSRREASGLKICSSITSKIPRACIADAKACIFQISDVLLNLLVVYRYFVNSTKCRLLFITSLDFQYYRLSFSILVDWNPILSSLTLVSMIGILSFHCLVIIYIHFITKLFFNIYIFFFYFSLKIHSFKICLRFIFFVVVWSNCI